MLFRRILLVVFTFWNTLLFGQNVFFNEIDHILPDICVELAVNPDVDLTNWSIVTYDNTGSATNTISLSGVPPTSTTQSGFHIIEVDVVFLHPTNGGVSLINDNNNPIQFISYGGPITAVDGPAIGETSENIGTQTATGNSQQLQGIGSEYTDFNWEVPGDASCGFENDGQTLLIPEAPLPVELLYFKGEKIADYIELSWTTISERNNHFFSIEKSLDGFNFEEIGRLEGANNSNVELKYTFQDYTPISTEMYYRLAQVDLDGSIHYSEVIIIESETDDIPIVLFPNPVKDQLSVFIPFSSDLIDLVIYDLMGKEIYRKRSTNIDIGNLNLTIGHLNAGSYILSIQIDEKQFHKKFIKVF